MMISGKKYAGCLILCGMLLMLAGCTSVPASGTAAQTEKAETEAMVMSIGDVSISKSEADVYLYLLQMPYEAVYGSGLWQTQRTETQSWGDWLLEELARQITEIEVLSQRAGREGMALTEEETTALQEEADAAYASMDTVAKAYAITGEQVRTVYEKSALAGRYYASVAEGYDVALSEEELAACRGMTVLQIFIAEEDTAHLTDGQTQAQLAESLRARAAAGEDFETLAKAYSSENAQWCLSFDQEGYVFDTDGWLEEAFTASAWALQPDEISSVIHTSYGYHVLKCTEVDSEELKQQAAEHQRTEKEEERFAADYEKWLDETVCTRETAWQEMAILDGIAVN